jgi:hypothetical protein
VSWLALGGATALQLLAGIVRVRGWFHVIRQCSAEARSLRYRDVAMAQLGGCGWNAVLPARAGDAVKVALVSRKLPATPVATLASTLVAPAAVDAGLTVVLVAALVAAGVIAPDHLTPDLPGAAAAPIMAGVACLGLAAGILFRRRARALVREIRCGLRVVGRPRFLATRILPWQLGARALRLTALALVLMAGGMAFSVGPALALMALLGASPSMAPAATAMRIALLAGVFAALGGNQVPAEDVAAALVAWYAMSSLVNLAASGMVTAWVLRTLSPRCILVYARTALRAARRGAPQGTPGAPQAASPAVPPTVAPSSATTA